MSASVHAISFASEKKNANNFYLKAVKKADLLNRSDDVNARI